MSYSLTCCVINTCVWCVDSFYLWLRHSAELRFVSTTLQTEPYRQHGCRQRTHYVRLSYANTQRPDNDPETGSDLPRSCVWRRTWSRKTDETAPVPSPSPPVETNTAVCSLFSGLVWAGLTLHNGPAAILTPPRQRQRANISTRLTAGLCGVVV